MDNPLSRDRPEAVAVLGFSFLGGHWVATLSSRREGGTNLILILSRWTILGT